MELIYSLVLLTLTTCFHVVSQPIPYDKSGLSFYYELINPRWRNHRTRLRAFTNVLGSPIANIRGARSTKESKKPSDLEPKAECFYTFDSLHCAGITGDKSEPTTVECDVRENFNHTQLVGTSKFAMSDIRIFKFDNKFQNETVAKIYLFGQKDNTTWFDYRMIDAHTNSVNIFSIHSAENSGESEKGIEVLDKNCWNKMVHFFMSIRVADEVMVQKSQFVLPIKSIANLQII